MIKIYVQNKPLFLLDEVIGEAEGYRQRPDTVFMDDFSSSAPAAMLRQLEQPSTVAGIFLHSNTTELLDCFKASLTPVVAAGGLVYTPDEHLLLIFRRGKWDLPKGKLDEGESLEECALREIGEETGVNSLTVEQPLPTTYHTYYEKGRLLLKVSNWYLMTAPSKLLAQPQTEEDIEKCEWVSVHNLAAYRNNMHASVIDVIDAGLKTLARKGFTQTGLQLPSSD